jgi:hypothetical protein
VTASATKEKRRIARWDPSLFERHSLFAPLLPFASRFAACAEFPCVATIDRELSASAGVNFVAQPPLTRKERRMAIPYDQAILAGTVPTREGSWHDFLNALVWAAFPKAKLAVHALQSRLIEQASAAGIVGRRTPAHDAVAVLDEGGVLLLHGEQAPSASAAETIAALTTWATSESAAEPPLPLTAMVFGHGVFESVAIEGPWPLVRAALLSVSAQQSVDQRLAEWLMSADAPTGPKSLLPVSPGRLARLLGGLTRV